MVLTNTSLQRNRLGSGERGSFDLFQMSGDEVFSKSYPAVATSVPEARSAITRFAAGAGVSSDQVETIRLAVSEALTNVVVHAYGASPGELHVTAAITPHEFWVLVADDGGGLRARPDSPGLGLGLALIAQLTAEFSIVKRAVSGTELRMRFDFGALQTGARGAGADEAEQN